MIAQLRTERLVRAGNLGCRVFDHSLRRLQLAASNAVAVTTVRVSAMFIIVPAQSVPDFCLKTFFKNQPGRQFHQLALGIVYAHSSVDKLVQGLTCPLGSGYSCRHGGASYYGSAHRLKPVDEESPRRMHLLQIPSNFRTSPPVSTPRSWRALADTQHGFKKVAAISAAASSNGWR